MILKNRKPNRLKTHNYSNNNTYFITICTKNRQNFLGEIKNKQMILNKNGEIAKKCWTETPTHFQNTEIDQYIIMPNHIHAIITIHQPVGNRHACSLQRQYQKLPTIIGSFKSAVSKLIRRQNQKIHFQWQKSYHDHIIRNEQSLNNIRTYIINNPSNWNTDQNNTKQLPLAFPHQLK